MNGSKDNFEDFFHESFSDSEVVKKAGDWNVPSEMVWDEIQEGLTEERKLSIAFLKWPWSAIAASYFLFVFGYQFLEKNVDKTDIKEIAAVEATIAPTDINLELDATPSMDELIRPDKGSTTNNIAFTTSINNLSTKQIAGLDKQVIDAFEITENSLVVNEAREGQEKWTSEPLDFHFANNLINFESPEEKININSITPALKKSSSIYLAANYSIISENSKIYTASDTPTGLMRNEKNAKGTSVGVNVGWANKKGWAIETGVHYTQLENETVGRQTIPTEVLAANENSQGVSNVDLTLNDAYGSSEIGLRLFNANNPSEKGTPLSIRLAQSTQSRFVEIPLLVRKNWRFGKWSVGIKTGLLNRFNVSNASESPNITVEDNEFEVLASDFRRDTRIENNKYTPQIIAGIGVEYFIQPNLSVYAEPSFSKSLRPTIDFGFASIQSQNMAMMVGMRYHL